MVNRKRLVVLLGAALGMGGAQFAGAQQGDAMASGLVLEEVLVTARKRQESLFDVPGAISSIDTEMLIALGMNDARDLLTLVPTAFLAENVAGTARDVNIRGVGTPSLFAESGVATYIDEVYSSGYISYPTQFYDIERIEVLRGPQGALYGRNAVGGAVNVISARASDEFEGRVRAAYGRYERLETDGTINIPISSGFSARLTGWYTEQDEGEYFNPTVNEYIDANDSRGFRGVFSFDPSERLAMELIVETTDAETAGTALFFPDSGETKKTVARDDHPRNEFETTRLAFIAEYESDWGLFTAVLGSREYELDGVEDTDLTATNPFDLLTGELGKQTTTRSNEVESDYLELRWLSTGWDRLEVLAGFNYLEESAVGTTQTVLPTVSENFSGGTAPAILNLHNDQSLESWAVFAEATYAFTDTLDAIVSMRYTEDDKTVDFDYEPTALVAGFIGAGQFADESRSFDNFSPGFTLAWAPDDDLRFYGKVQSGFRAGGYNFNVGSIVNLPYDEETSLIYELGARAELLDGRAVVAATAFMLEQEDVLVPLFDLTVPGPLGGYLANVAEAETYGLELEGTVRVVESLTLGASLGWLDAEFTSGEDSFDNNIEGNKLPAARDLTYAVTASYRKALNDRVELLADGSYTYRDDGYVDLTNMTEISDAKLLNLSAGFAYGDLQVLVYGKNLLDDDYDLAFGFRPPASSGVIRATGETYGVSVQYSF